MDSMRKVYSEISSEARLNSFPIGLSSITSLWKGIDCRYLREYQALGTAGGLYLFRDAILKGDPKTLIVMHADVCCSFPLEDMLAMHKEKQAIGTMLGTKVSPEAATNFGCIVSDPQTHEVLHYVEKPSSYISSTINCGVYLFDTSLFRHIREVMTKVDQLMSETNYVEGTRKGRSWQRLRRPILGRISSWTW